MSVDRMSATDWDATLVAVRCAVIVLVGIALIAGVWFASR